MEVFRIVQQLVRTKDLSGTGAFRTGGRWNNKGVYMLYTAANSSLALLESLVHFDPIVVPQQLYIMTLNIADSAPLFELPFADYPKNWMDIDLLENKIIGDRWMTENKFLVFKVRSAINSFEFNYLLNPLFPGFHNLVKVTSVTAIDLDGRLIAP